MDNRNPASLAKQQSVLQFVNILMRLGAGFSIVLAIFPFDVLKWMFDALASDGHFTFLTVENSAFFRFLFILAGLILFSASNGPTAWGRFYGFLIALLYGIIFSGQVLGFFKIYRLNLVLPLTIAVTGSVYWVYSKYFLRDFSKEIFQFPSKNSRPYPLDVTFGIAGLLLVTFLELIPVIIWPYSSVSPTLNWDVGKYHLPKALEMVSTGSAWDMTISYGAYPYGYESLFSFAAILMRNGYLFGSVQALGNLFLVFTLWFLMRRYSRLPNGILLFFSSLLTTGWFFFSNLKAWRIFHLPFYDIGKNDLFLAASVLAVLFHAPLGTKREQLVWYPFGMALATMIAFSVKPNAIIVVAPLWLWALYLSWDRIRKSPDLLKKAFVDLLGLGLVIFPGLMWVLRNWIAQGVIFKQEILVLQERSILNNLTNPDFYQNIPPGFFVLIGILLLSLPAIIFKKQITWSLWATYLLLFLGFISTPATAFVHSLGEQAYISWRFGVALFVFASLFFLIFLDPWFKQGYEWLLRQRLLQFVLAFIVFVGTFAGLWNNRWKFLPTQENALVLEDPYQTAVGVNGYHSAIDYVQKNIRHSVVQIDNALPYYAYGAGFTNSTTLTKKADVLVILQTDWKTGKHLGYPEMLDEEDWKKTWALIYEDAEGRVYQRR